MDSFLISFCYHCSSYYATVRESDTATLCFLLRNCCGFFGTLLGIINWCGYFNTFMGSKHLISHFWLSVWKSSLHSVVVSLPLQLSLTHLKLSFNFFAHISSLHWFVVSFSSSHWLVTSNDVITRSGNTVNILIESVDYVTCLLIYR